MAFELEGDESLADGVRRVAAEQIGKAAARLATRRAPSTAAIHDVRKRLKKVRALLRLVRDDFPAYEPENDALRAIAARLAPARDAAVMVETFDALRARFRGSMRARGFARLRDLLIEQRQAAARTAKDTGGISEARQELRALASRIATWEIADAGEAAITSGVARTYRRARKAFARAYRTPTAECFHELRKAAKVHWYHTCLLERVWPPVMKGYRAALHDIGELVGEDHDLAVLGATLETLPDADAGALATVQGLIERRQHDLRTEIETISARVYADRTKAWRCRFRVYWNAWRSENQRRSLFGRDAARV